MRILRVDPPATLIALGLMMAAGSLAARPHAGAQMAGDQPEQAAEREAACQNLFERVSPYPTIEGHRNVPALEADSAETVRRSAAGTDGEQAIEVEYACVFETVGDAPASLEITVHHY